MKKIPLWGIEVNKRLIEKGMTKRELANKIHVNYTQLCSVISGTVINDTIKASVCSYLGMEVA